MVSLGNAELDFGAPELRSGEKGYRASKHREHTTAMAQTGQQRRARKKVTRHAHSPLTPNA